MVHKLTLSALCHADCLLIEAARVWVHAVNQCGISRKYLCAHSNLPIEACSAKF